MGVDGRLFQARMWREYAMAWDGRKPSFASYPAWFARVYLESVIGVSRDQCLRRSRINVYLARRLNRTKAATVAGEGME